MRPTRWLDKLRRSSQKRLKGGTHQAVFPLLAGNLIEGTIDHHSLGIHHVNEPSRDRNTSNWDIGFLVWGTAMLVIGIMVMNAGERELPAARGLKTAGCISSKEHSLKQTLIVMIASLVLSSVSGCTLIAVGLASTATKEGDGSERSAESKAPVIRLENDVNYSEPADRREK